MDSLTVSIFAPHIIEMPESIITKQTWLDCVELRHMYVCDGVGRYALKEPWSSNGVNAVPAPRKQAMLTHQPMVQLRIDGSTGYAAGTRLSHLAAASACHSCGDTPETSKYGGKHGSYDRYLLKKKGGYLR